MSAMRPGSSGLEKSIPASGSRVWLLVPIALVCVASGKVSMQEKVSYDGWANCIRVTNGQIEMIATTDVGPRIIRFGYVGGPNILKEYAEEIGKTGGDQWRLYGGHRFWQAPEDLRKTYAPDNSPVGSSWDGRTLKLTQRVDASGVEKEIEITVDQERNHVRVLHRITNRIPASVTLAPWALSSLAPGGRAIFPQEPYRSHDDYLLPVRALALWGYTDMKDPRWSWGTRYIQLRQDPTARTPQKVGMTNTPGWGAYTIGGFVFIKRLSYDSAARYPDFGNNCEMYTDANMLEIESLGGLTQLAQNAAVEHIEEWYLFRATIGKDEDSIDRELLPLVHETDPPRR